MGNTIDIPTPILENDDNQNFVQKYNDNIRLMFIGPSASGKTTFINSYLKQENTVHESTIGVEYTNIFKNNTNYHIYDTTGIQKYRHILQSYYSTIDAYVLMIEHNNNNFMSIITSYCKDIVEYGKTALDDKIIFVVINMKDSRRIGEIDMSSDITKLCHSINKKIIIHKLNLSDQGMLNDTMDNILNYCFNNFLP